MGRSTSGQALNERVIEAVNRAWAVISSEHRRDETLDAITLDLHEQLRSSAHELADVSQRRDLARLPRLSEKLPVAQLADHGGVRQRWIVVDDDDSVRRGMDVELDAVGARVEGEREAGEGVFPRQTRHAAVRDAKGQSDRSGHGGRDRGSVELYVIGWDGRGELLLNDAPNCTSNLPDRMIDDAGDADEQTDLDLITRWKDGDHRAATLLVERHAEAVARFASSVGARGDVQDVVQDTFVRAFASLDSFRGDSSLRTWLFTIAV